MLNGADDLGRSMTAAVAEGARSRRLESTFFMINVIFLLLLFFVVAGNLNMNVEVSPPRSDAELPMQLQDVQLAIDAAGASTLNGTPVAADGLSAAVKALGAVRALSIAADAGVDAVVVARALEAMRELKLERVTLVTLGRAGADGQPPR